MHADDEIQIIYSVTSMDIILKSRFKKDFKVKNQDLKEKLSFLSFQLHCETRSIAICKNQHLYAMSYISLHFYAKQIRLVNDS